MHQLEIKYMRVSDLKPYEGNAKIHTEQQIEQIMESIRQFGMNDPIAVWRDNEIIEGHGRLIACEQIDRTCLMMEYDSHYADVILDRWEKFTGGHAERIDG